VGLHRACRKTNVNRTPSGARRRGGPVLDEAAVGNHLRLLEAERERIGRQIASVKTTLRKTEEKEQLMPEEAFDGFDHTRYEQEVVDRWGRDAYEAGDRWWRSLSDQEKAAFVAQQRAIAEDFAAACTDGAAPESDRVQAIAERHVQWLGITSAPTRGYVIGVGEMYVADPRFTATYDQHGAGTATLVRDALRVYAERNLSDHTS